MPVPVLNMAVLVLEISILFVAGLSLFEYEYRLTPEYEYDLILDSLATPC